MEIKIETDRLIIRPYEKEDYENWYAEYDKRLPSQYKYDDGRPSDMPSSTFDWFCEWIKGFNKAAINDEMYQYGVFRKEDGVNVGKVELFKILRLDYQWAMMGYSIHNQYWQMGYGSESVSATKEWVFKNLGFQRIELHINTDNLPSIRLAEKNGFKLECTREKFAFENGEWTDFLIYYQLHKI
ncbi:GNAT family N-acetyltransferase [Paenisporosarcina sp.]|uniref:GNAT family N-acetyltransferase n=1 Tax=Paenisporosarcina sp. TaxID=1932001 RepID=UPI003C78139B